MSIPGFGKRLVADFLASTGTDLTAFGTAADSLASPACTCPTGLGEDQRNHHRPRRYDRRLMNACFLAAFIASTNCPASAPTTPGSEGGEDAQAGNHFPRPQTNERDLGHAPRRHDLHPDTPQLSLTT
ncbi:transposase [Leifsonia shinshuensis]|uniref:transposase n=1 Tax=Leifsonia shinshuensis TaxID=150026 RepID=UPI003CD0BE01